MKLAILLLMSLVFVSPEAYSFAQNNSVLLSGNQIKLRCHFGHTVAEVATIGTMYYDCQHDIEIPPPPYHALHDLDSHSQVQHAWTLDHLPVPA